MGNFGIAGASEICPSRRCRFIVCRCSAVVAHVLGSLSLSPVLPAATSICSEHHQKEPKYAEHCWLNIWSFWFFITYCVNRILSSLQGWSYVGDRLLSAVVPYEETGWYDGQLYVKPPEVCVLTLAMACASAPFLEANALCHISSSDDVCVCLYIDIGFSLSSLTFSQFRTQEICLAFSSFVVLSPGLCVTSRFWLVIGCWVLIRFDTYWAHLYPIYC